MVRVRILDLSGASEHNVVEQIGGFPTLMHANAFARAYVRDSVERCRVPGATAKDVLETWFAYGEDAEVLGARGEGWSSATELHDFAARPVRDAEERNWRALDPRRHAAEDEEGAGE